MVLKGNVLGIVAFVFFTLLIIAYFFGPRILREIREGRIRESGLSAPARVLDVIDTGDRHNANPVCRVIVEVMPGSGENFRSELRLVLSPVDLTKIGKGSVINVKYDPKDPAHAVLAN